MLIDTYTLMVDGAAMAGSPDRSLVEKALELLEDHHKIKKIEIVKGQSSDSVKAGLNWYTRTSFKKEIEGLNGNSFALRVHHIYEGK